MHYSESAAGIIRQAAGARQWCDPRELAFRFGLDLAVGHEDTTGTCVVYAWDPCQRVRGRAVYLGIATAWLLRTGGAMVRTEGIADALAVPRTVVECGGVQAVLARQEHYPIDAIWAAAERLAPMSRRAYK